VPADLQAPDLPRLLLSSLLVVLAACSSSEETPVAKAALGAPLVRMGERAVYLEEAFRPGVANGLYKGVVRITGPAGSSQHHELNGICSMPGLQAEGWPAYDNLYGQPLGATGKEPAASSENWQILFYFDGRVETRGTPPDQQLLTRLRDNLCRRGSFDDSSKTINQ
jgi:hypothetical protein